MAKKSFISSSTNLDYDVIIIGAGISGINAAYRLQNQAPPGTTYIILEARDTIGGTWDLFRYPGIRSDSDIFTFGFSWNPWPKQETLAMGPEIKQYMIQSAKAAGIYENIHFENKVRSANWVSQGGCWELSACISGSEHTVVYRSRFIFLGTGYYDYEHPLQAPIPGIGDFQGKVIHPQLWPEDYDFIDKNMVVIGSGATAISIVPAVAGKTKHVTMLQRSPTYIYPLSNRLKSTTVLFHMFPKRVAEGVIRMLWILEGYAMLALCRSFPNASRKHIRSINKKLLPPDFPIDPHFEPRYNPWQQRLCVSMDGDIFAAIRSGRASIVTDVIETVTKDSIRLASGATLHPDVIVTATGLKVKFGGGIQFSVDNKPVDPTESLAWRACMLQDIPNLIFSFGYENASWTLGADCAAQLLTRFMWEFDKRSLTAVSPHVREGDKKMEARPLFSLSATYLKNIKGSLPMAGTEGPWRPRSHYAADFIAAKWGSLESGLLWE